MVVVGGGGAGRGEASCGAEVGLNNEIQNFSVYLFLYGGPWAFPLEEF